MESKTIIEAGLPNFVFAIEDAIRDGWEVDRHNAPYSAWQFCCEMVRDTPTPPVVIKQRNAKQSLTAA